MNKDFWERIDRLEELAGKATQGEWLIATSDGIDWGDLYITTEDRDKADIQWIATVDDAIFRANETPTDFQKEQNANACYISAANPAMIKEMIAEIKDLQSQILAYQAGCNTVGCLREKEIHRLEKEADWLAEKACKCSFAYRNKSCHHLCVGNCSICLYENRTVTSQDFREAARKAVSEADNA